MVPTGLTMPLPEMSGAEPNKALVSKQRHKKEERRELTVNRLINTIALALPIRNTTQRSTRQKPNRPRNNRRLIANNITKQVAGDHHTVQRPRVLDHQHSRRVNQLVVHRQLRELLLKHLRHNLSPQSARGQNVGLVQTPDLGRGVLAQSQETSQTGDALNLGAGVGLGVHGETGTVVLLAVTKVDTAGQLTDDDEVSAAADLGFERGGIDEGLGGEVAWAEVAVGAELLAELEDTLFGTDGGGRAPFGTTDGAEEDGIGGLGGGEGFVGQGAVVGGDGGLEGSGLAGWSYDSRNGDSLKAPRIALLGHPPGTAFERITTPHPIFPPASTSSLELLTTSLELTAELSLTPHYSPFQPPFSLKKQEKNNLHHPTSAPAS